MADSGNRQAKVAAGLKKLKQFQQKSKGAKAKKSAESLDGATTQADAENAATKQNKTKPNAELLVDTVNKDSSIVHSDAITHKSEEVAHKAAHDTTNTSISNISGITTTGACNPNSSVDKAIFSSPLPDEIKTSNGSRDSEQRTRSSLHSNDSKPRELSSAESLRQITQQVNGLVLESHAYLNGDIDAVNPSSPGSGNKKELEQRNQELAALVEEYRQANEHLEFQLSELKGRINRIQRDFERERTELQERAHKEQVAIKDQLQVHIQTIGILVAEKTELQSSLSQSQLTAKQKAAEAEELQGRLRALRQRITDLEKELAIASNSSHQLEKSSKDFSKEVDRLKMEVYKLTKTEDELKQQNSELLERLNKKMSECQELEQELSSTKSKLSLAELYNQQLSSSSDQASSQKLEELYQEKLQLEKKVAEYEESLEKLAEGKKEISDQYHNFVQQLSQQVTSLKDELKTVTEERDILQRIKTEMEERVASLESTCASSAENDRTIEDLKQSLESVEKDNKELKDQLQTQLNDNSQMSHLLQEQEVKLEQLESTLAQYREQQADKEGLLQAIQSEKVAASRAVAQNKELKKQLEELQTAFVQMSNSKLELTEKLQHEQHVCKELGERLTQQEEELQEFRDLVAEKDRELQELQQSSTKLTKEMYQQHQIVDRFRHYEAQGQLTEMLQKELEQAQQRINALVNQNTELRMALARQAESTVNAADNNNEVDAGKKSDLVASLSASVRQLEMERDQLLSQLEEQRHQMDSFNAQLNDLKENRINQGNSDDVVSAEEYRKLKDVLEQLEVRFKRTMDQIAELSDQKQQLEHLVIQLQGETDTIGDYIALYQMQRGIMRKRAAEKDDYIAQLARDREELKAKLVELQALVVKLLQEKQQLGANGDASNLTFPVQSVVENGFSAPAISSEPQGNGLDTSSTTIPEEPLPSGKAVDASTTPQQHQQASTATKIMALLSDIGTSNLIEGPVSENFHPCPVCSGRLMTV